MPSQSLPQPFCFNFDPSNVFYFAPEWIQEQAKIICFQQILFLIDNFELCQVDPKIMSGIKLTVNLGYHENKIVVSKLFLEDIISFKRLNEMRWIECSLEESFARDICQQVYVQLKTLFD